MTDDGNRPATQIDARGLRALAHPVRVQILNVLAAEGAATSTTLARRLGESTGTLSWHLRHLARYGLIEEEPERGTRRERWWRAPHGRVVLADATMFEAPQLRGPLAAVLRETVEYHFQLASSYWARVRSGQVDREWVDAATMISSGGTPMSPRQLSALNRELLEVIRRHSRAAEGAVDPDREPVVVLLHSFPVPTDDSRGRQAPGSR
jgi:DNA-binding transcriptional ArsR family regulator